MNGKYMIIFMVTFNISTIYSALDLDQCNQALGMNSGEITDDRINSSSSHNNVNVGPQNARLNREINGGAWCPKKQISENVLEYLEISLNSLHAITQVATQGRFGNGQGLEYAEKYMLEYWRPGLSRWIRFKNRSMEHIFDGNSDTYTVVKRKIDPVIIASKLRFIPYSVHDRTICMRVEIYGCVWNDGILSYSMPQGERRGIDVDLSDMTYDGVKDDSYLHGGLGQLTDGIKGHDNFRLDVDGFGKGYGWVGWKNDSSPSKPITMIFEFDSVRNFSAVYFYCNNMYTKDIEVFALAKIWFSVGGKYFNEPSLLFSYMPDKYLERARNVTIHLYNRIGRFVKIELYFASKWMLVSEISFNSVTAYGNFSEEEPPPQIVSTAINENALSNEYVGLVIGVLAAVILLLVVAILLIVLRNKRRKYATSHSMLKPNDNNGTVSMKDLEFTYLYSSPPNYQRSESGIDKHVIVSDVDQEKVFYREPRDFKLKYDGTYSNVSTQSREYAVPDVTKTSGSRYLARDSHNSGEKVPLEGHYAATDIIKLQNVQDLNKDYVYPTPGMSILKNQCFVDDSPRHELHYIQEQAEEALQERTLDGGNPVGPEYSRESPFSPRRFNSSGYPAYKNGRGRREPNIAIGRLLQNGGTHTVE